MNSFWSFVKKEFFHIFRDAKTMLILFAMPVAQILIFGYVVSNEIKDIRIAILDQAQDEVSREITQKILSSGYFILDENLYHPDQIEAVFQEGDIREVIVFPDNLAKKMEHGDEVALQVIADASDANTANLISNYTRGIVNNYLQQEVLPQEPQFQIDTRVRMYFNPEMKGVFMFVPGTMALILILISAMMTSISIAREKELGTMEILLVSPLRPVQIIIGKVIPYILLAFINALTIVILSYFVFQLPVQGSLVLLLAECLLYILLALSLGILISTLSNSQQVAMFISMFALMLPTLLLSGFIFPIENMPKALQWLSSIMPAKYFITIVKSIMIKGVGFGYIWKETLVLLVMMMVFIGLSVKNFKVRL